MTCGSKDILKNAPYNTHDVKDLVNHGMDTNTKTSISGKRNITLCDS